MIKLLYQYNFINFQIQKTFYCWHITQNIYSACPTKISNHFTILMGLDCFGWERRQKYWRGSQKKVFSFIISAINLIYIRWGFIVIKECYIFKLRINRKGGVSRNLDWTLLSAAMERNPQIQTTSLQGPSMSPGVLASKARCKELLKWIPSRLENWCNAWGC